MPLFGQQLEQFARSAGVGCRLRLAPTPSGFLHVGNALNFIFNWLVARRNNGRLLLRIDDLDAARKRPEYILDIFESLEWLGLDWDEGPRSLPDFEMNWSQYRRISLYTNLLQELRETGLLFACRKSRSDLAGFSIYPDHFREQELPLDAPDVSWRIRTAPDFPMKDFVVRRRDGLPAYQVASLADDLFFGITHVVRGQDLEASSVAQRWLAETIGADDFLKISFLHHPLLLDESGEKLSKSAGASSLRARRLEGASAEFVFQQAARMLGLPEAEIKTAQNLLNFFDR